MTDNAQQAADRIREALGAGPTPGPWIANLFTSSFEIVTPGDFRESMTLCTRYQYEEKASEMLANGMLIAACSPDNLHSLLAERDEMAKDAARRGDMLREIVRGLEGQQRLYAAMNGEPDARIDDTLRAIDASLTKDQA